MTPGDGMGIMAGMARRGKVPESKKQIGRSATSGGGVSAGKSASVPPKVPPAKRDVSPPPPRERTKDAPAPGEISPAPPAPAVVVPTIPSPPPPPPPPQQQQTTSPEKDSTMPPQTTAAPIAAPAPSARPVMKEIPASDEGNGKVQTDAVGFAKPQAAEPVAPVLAPAQPPVEPVAAPAPQPPLLFEIAWEVCWQLGGIYTVLRSKADCMKDRWDDRYCLIGPYNPQTAAVEFEERPTEGIIRETLDRLRAQGIPCHFGRWLIPGRPRVILLDYRARYGKLDADKYLLWKDHGISTSAHDGEVNEVTAFGFTVTEFFRELSNVVGGSRTILAHFHEWMAGVAVPRIAHLKLPVTTVFTTHATLLGRYLASDSPEFYNHLPFINPDEQAGKYNIWPRYAIERAAAHASTVFTTVSEVTAYEAERLLGRKPDAILPNGLNIRRFSAIHEFQNLHRAYKERIHEFVMGHFFPSYTFDLDNTIYVFTSGRYEYRNKGMDLFIEALARLNWRMKGMPAANRPTVIGFIITRAQTRSINVQALQSQSMFDDIRNTCGEIQENMGERLFHSAANGRIPTFQELMPDDAQVRLKRAMHAWRTSRQPLIVTHDLADDANDPILQHLRARNLCNGGDDPVKMVFHPEFVTQTSPLLTMDYDQFVRGCHLGVFPSYYEPWGYTPMESIAMGVPAVTTDLSGFGAYVQRHIPDAAQNGVTVLNRRYKSFDESVEELTNYLFEFARQTRRQRIELRNRVERMSELFDWSALVKHYHEAHDLAMQRVGATVPGKLEVRVV
jgi:glycogen(starch) synthase